MSKRPPRPGDRVRVKDDVKKYDGINPSFVAVPGGTIGVVIRRQRNVVFPWSTYDVVTNSYNAPPYSVIKVDKRRRGVLVSEVWLEDKDVEIITGEGEER